MWNTGSQGRQNAVFVSTVEAAIAVCSLNISFASSARGACAEYLREQKSFDQINDATESFGSSFFIAIQCDTALLVLC